MFICKNNSGVYIISISFKYDKWVIRWVEIEKDIITILFKSKLFQAVTLSPLLSANILLIVFFR